MGLKKIIPILLLLMLFITPAFAAITVTWGTPTAETKYSNNAANRQTIDVNFAFTDGNSAVNDMDFNLFLRKQSGTWAFRTLLDVNIYAASLASVDGVNCFVKTAGDGTGSCNYNWTMPLNEEMSDGYYCLDANVREFRDFPGINAYSTDANATRCFYIYTGFAEANAIRSIASNFGLVLGAVVLLMGLFSIAILKTDVKTTALVTIVAAIVVAIGSMVIGTMVGII